MKPYIAILIDSFWEAVSNKVLWALLICWSLVLLALVPFGYISETSYQLTRWDVQDRQNAVEELRLAVRGGSSSEMQAIAAKLRPEFATRLKKIETKQSPELEKIKTSDVANELNHVLKATDLYSEDAFTLPKEGKRRERLDPLINAEPGTLSDLDREELNRELIQMALKRQIARSQGEQLWIGYGGFKLGNAIPISRRAISEYIEPLVLSAIVKLGLGVLAVLIAIVVTSPIIPDTFRSGSLHLLLSKPISRVWLYLSKFFGGTIFVLVNITFVLTGLYLIAGIRFDIWNTGLLVCIPLLMFVFVIFYSVSALAGLIWGNAIVCVICCMVFWASCFAIGAVHDAMTNHFEVNQQVTRIVPAGDDLLVVDNEGRVNVWNPDYAVWQPAMERESQRKSRTFGPFYDAENQRIISKSFFSNPFGGLGGKNRELNLVSLTEETLPSDSDSAKTSTDEQPAAPAENSDSAIDQASDTDAPAESSEDADSSAGSSKVDSEALADSVDSADKARNTPRWSSDAATPLPEQLFDLFYDGKHLIAVCRTGIHQLEIEDLKLVEQKPDFLGLSIPWIKQQKFTDVTPVDFIPGRSVSSTLSRDGNFLAVFSTGTVSIVACDAKKFRLELSSELGEAAEEEDDLPGSGNEAALLQLSANHCVIARAGSPIQILDRELNAQHTIAIPDDGEARQMRWMGDSNRIALLTQSGECYEIDCDNGSISPLQLPISGDMTAMSWQDENTAWIVSKPSSAYLVDLEANTVLEQRVPQATTWYAIFQWVIKPIYYVNPKPAALDNAMNYVLSGNKTQSLSIVATDLEEAQLEFDIWQPVISNTAFVVFMLAVGSVYVLRREY